MPPKSDTLSPYVVSNGHTIDGKNPGDTVTLNDADAERFRALGFILDDDGNRLIAIGAGPAVNVEDGVQIKPA